MQTAFLAEADHLVVTGIRALPYLVIGDLADPAVRQIDVVARRTGRLVDDARVVDDGLDRPALDLMADLGAREQTVLDVEQADIPGIDIVRLAIARAAGIRDAI